jgi:hypothetical protein
MSIGYWIVAGIVAFVFFALGLMKLTSPRAKLIANPQAGWANDFTEPQIKLIGLAEFLGSAGLILPPAFGVAKWLHIPAAIGLIVLMLGAISTHLRRKEPPFLPLVIGVLALVTLFL